MFSLSRVVVDDGTFRDRAERISLLSLVLFFFFFFFAQRERERERETERERERGYVVWFFFWAVYFFLLSCFVFEAPHFLHYTQKKGGHTHTCGARLHERERERERERDHDQIFLKLDAVDVIRSTTFSASWRAEKAERERSVAG